MRHSHRTFRRTLGALAAGLSLAACAGNGGPTPAQAQLRLDRLIGDAACTRDDDCGTIGIGAMACGGPQAYAAWSKKATDAQALAQAAAEHRAERERQIARSGQQSICMVVADPGARCAMPAAGASAAGRCELRAPGSGGAAPTLR